jgi:hypothetical protein
MTIIIHNDTTANQNKSYITSCLPIMLQCTECNRTFGSPQALHAHCTDKADHAYCDSCERLFVNFDALRQVSNILVCESHNRIDPLYFCSSTSRTRLFIETNRATTARARVRVRVTERRRSATPAIDGLSIRSASINTSPPALGIIGVSSALVIFQPPRRSSK